MAKYLGETGLVYLWGKVKTWVGNYAKITTSGSVNTLTVGNASTTIQEKITSTNKLSADLISDGSTNKAYTATEKTKLSGIATGAEVNQNAFGKVKVGSTNIEADAKIDTLELAAANNSVLSITPDATNDKVTLDVDKDLSKYDNSTAGFITIDDVPEGSTASTTTPKMDGTAAVGTETAFARGDHRHPTDTSRAPLASPALTGTPTAPTATAGTNTTQVATTAFVTTAIENAQTGAAMFQGTAPTSFAPTNYKKGYYWVVGTAGTYCGETCEAGDMIYCIADYNSSFNNANFDIVQRNLDLAEMTTTDMDTATSNWT